MRAPIIINRYIRLFNNKQAFEKYLYSYIHSNNNLLNIDNNFYNKALLKYYNNEELKIIYELQDESNNNIINNLMDPLYKKKVDSIFHNYLDNIILIRKELLSYTIKKYLEMVVINNTQIKELINVNINNINSIYFFKRDYKQIRWLLNNDILSGIDIISNFIYSPIYVYHPYYNYVYDNVYIHDNRYRIYNKENDNINIITVLHLIFQLDSICRYLYFTLNNNKKFLFILRKGSIMNIINHDLYCIGEFIHEYNYYNKENIAPYFTYINNVFDFSKC